MKSRIIERICDTTIYEILNIKCIKNNELRYYVIRTRRNSNKVYYKEEFKDERILLNLPLQIFNQKR